MNGSSDIGHCSSVSHGGVTSTCTDPTSSVLFDGVIPTLTGLDGDMWASQLLTLHRTTSSTIEVAFIVTVIQHLERVEMTMFNCPEWMISVQSISLRDNDGIVIGSSGDLNSITSCNSLVRLCVPATAINPLVVLVQFDLGTDSNWVHLAEVTFYDDSSTCPPNTTITTEMNTANTPTTLITTTTATQMTPPPPTTPTIATTTTHMTPTTPITATTTLQEMTTATTFSHITTQQTPVELPTSKPSYIIVGHYMNFISADDLTPVDPTCNCTAQPNTQCDMSIILASVITAIITALLATVIFVLALIAVCKCHPKFTPGGAETGTSAGGEGQVYEQVDGGVAMSDPTYMEIGAGGGGGGRGGGNTFQLKENEAYATHTQH